MSMNERALYLVGGFGQRGKVGEFTADNRAVPMNPLE
jgi:hypothetical protein